MREIKFRAFCKINKNIVEVTNLCMDSGLGNIDTRNKDYEYNELLCGNYELMQYTERKDKNGVEIYEGDIVRILYTDWMSKHMGTEEQKAMTLDDYLISISHIDVVTYESCSFTLEKGSIFQGKHGFIEVIGNIHENKELLDD